MVALNAFSLRFLFAAELADLLCEFAEVLVHLILRQRSIYPQGRVCHRYALTRPSTAAPFAIVLIVLLRKSETFTDSKKYGLPVPLSRSSVLNDYIAANLKSLSSLLVQVRIGARCALSERENKGKVERFGAVVTHEGQVVEKILFEVASRDGNFSYALMESHFRSTIAKFSGMPIPSYVESLHPLSWRFVIFSFENEFDVSFLRSHGI